MNSPQVIHRVSDKENILQDGPFCAECGDLWPCPEERVRTLEAMVERAADSLRGWADMDDDGSPRLMVIAAEAKRTLKAMREIGGVN